VSGHQPETVDWFNVLVAQTLAQLRNEALHDDIMLKSLSAALNGSAKPDFLGSIAVTEMSLGDEFPIFSNCRIIPVDEAGVEVKSVGEGTRLLARLDVDLSDAITLGIETKLVLNYPMPTVAVLPVALAVSVVRFSGTVNFLYHLCARHILSTLSSFQSPSYQQHHQSLTTPRTRSTQPHHLPNHRPTHNNHHHRHRRPPSPFPSSPTIASTSQSAPWLALALDSKTSQK
jgi:hypothetical protein